MFSLFKVIYKDEGVSFTHQNKKNCTGLGVMSLGRGGSSRPDLGAESKLVSKGSGRVREEPVFLMTGRRTG